MATAWSDGTGWRATSLGKCYNKKIVDEQRCHPITTENARADFLANCTTKQRPNDCYQRQCAVITWVCQPGHFDSTNLRLPPLAFSFWLSSPVYFVCHKERITSVFLMMLRGAVPAAVFITIIIRRSYKQQPCYVRTIHTTV